MTRYPPGFEKLQGSQIDLLVAAVGGGNAVAVLRKGRRIENDHLEAPARFVVFLQQIEGVAFAEVTLEIPFSC